MEKRETWGGTIGFVLAAAGSAIGLGNIWKFPYITGINGGGAFVLVYLACIFLLGIPLMLSEIAIGRRTKRNPYGAFKRIAPGQNKFTVVLSVYLFLQAACMIFSGCYTALESGVNSGMIGFGILSAAAGWLVLWKGIAIIGLFSILTGLVILSYYSVVGAWILEYMRLAFSGNLNYNTIDEAKNAFGNFISSPWRVVGYHLLFMLLCAGILWGGIRKGVERWSKILMPALLFLLIAVIIRSVTLPGAIKGVEFFLFPDFAKLSTASVLEALGHSFYSLSLGMGIMITYGSYMKKEENIFTTSVFIIILDTIAALMAGLAIFPAVFAMHFEPGAGPSLIFQILPVTFNHFPGGFGWFWAGLFFLMLSIAALTSGASLLEMGVTFLIDQLKISRKKAVSYLFSIIFVLGIFSAISISGWENIPWMKKAFDFCFSPEHVKGSFFDLLDYTTSNWSLPIAGMMTAIFAGWIWTARRTAREFRKGAKGIMDINILLVLSGFQKEPFYRDMLHNGLTLTTLWAILIRYFTPIVILLVFLHSLGINLGF